MRSVAFREAAPKKKNSISEAELRACEGKLLIFVAKAQDMSRQSVMTFNIYSLLHLVQLVRVTGPLWSLFDRKNVLFLEIFFGERI